MIKRICLLTIIVSGLVEWSTFAIASDNKPILREERRIIINGVEETWRLEWLSPPTAACGPEDEEWVICPCNGFAFGETGDLRLVRKRLGRKDEQFRLNPLFEYGEDQPAPGAVLRRWDVRDVDHKRWGIVVEKNRDKKSAGPQFFADEGIKARPLATIMEFFDYDHDGRATEFLLQIGTMPCGKRMCVVVGISRNNDRLHFFTSVNRPKEPLILTSWQWDALGKSKAPVRVIDWRCGDHASEEETEVELRAQNGSIYAARRTYKCVGEPGSQEARGRLLKKEDF